MRDNVIQQFAVEVVIVPSDISQALYSASIATVVDGQVAQVCIGSQSSQPCILPKNFTELLESVIQPDVSDNVIPTLLLRQRNDTLPFYAYHDPTKYREQPNVRATRLAIACGLYSIRFHGPVVLSRGTIHNLQSLDIKDVFAACCISSDFRESTLNIVASAIGVPITTASVPDWIGNACRNNYLDMHVLRRLADVMNVSSKFDDHDDETEEIQVKDKMCISSDTTPTTIEQKDGSIKIRKEFITNVPLCIHCRRPASTLCSKCSGAYCCESPATCRIDGWSHDCLCRTWSLYVSRRSELSAFVLGDWHKELVSRPFQISEIPYELFLYRELGSNLGPWWQTELSGWSGGESNSARMIDVTIRRSYSEGFAPLSESNKQIPPEQAISTDDNSLTRNELGLICLRSWDEYYLLRGLDANSIAALLLTYPLTLYYAITEFGEVPCTVANMLKRRLRIHIVGSEKEMNFLDLFKEISYLIENENNLPYGIEMVFIVRKDMIPTSSKSILQDSQRESFSIDVTSNLRIVLVSGTYGDSASLDPNFDCGSGPPDMIIAFNAGLYAYDSWRNVILYLDQNPNVVGVFTDYNEYSGVQCASLGGIRRQKSLHVNPFRQPRAMPVYSMNLPQFSNGFMYVFNQQSLE